MTKKDKGITVRLTPEVAEKFKAHAQKNDMSQGEFLEELLNKYGKNQGPNSEVSNKIVEHSILLSYENLFLEDESKQIKEPKRYIVKGRYIYTSQQQNPYLAQLYGSDKLYESAKLYEDEIKKNFNIDVSLNEYRFFYWFGIIDTEDTKKHRYVIVETISLQKENDIKYMLSTTRCQFANGLSDITEHIRPYARLHDIKSIQSILAKEITSDEDVLSFLQ
ncbi:ribbon-helix-helix protein, CopG family [Alkalibaculum bacchi]|jgi:hypothetical protein|uniref:ribbon-helix-helix protein, CopG family n=1 Tax=Alkalibaculum bacchi TaxID=645887 RepID=UPI0026EC63D2|nr:ribbon-helix-helix protein, CopG family [Alkalibaculum bacchi]